MTARKNTRLAVMLLAVCMVASMLGACTPASPTAAASTTAPAPSTAAATAETSAAATQSAAEDPYYIEGGKGTKFTFWCSMDTNQTQYFSSLAEHPYFKWLEQKTGVSIEFIHPSGEQMDQQLTLMIASKNFYDFLMNPMYPGGPQAGIDEGCYLDLDPYLDKCMPNFKSAMTCSDGSFASWEWSDAEKEQFKPQAEAAFKDSLYTTKGNLWCVSQIWTNVNPTEAGVIIRKDWLDKAGLSMPVTLDDLEKVLAAFKAMNVIPMSIPASGYASIYTSGALTSAFDLGGYFTLNADDKTIDSHTYIQPAFKDYLTLLHDWYQKGYIDPDFMNSDYDTIKAKLLKDELGIWLDYWGDPGAFKPDYTGTQAFDMEAMPMPRKQADQVLKTKQYYNVAPTNWLCVTASCKNPDIACQWIDKSFMKDSILQSTYGVEGDTYEMKDGVPVYTQSFFNNPDMPVAIAASIKLLPNFFFYYSVRANTLKNNKGDNTSLSTMSKASQVWDEGTVADMYIPYTLFSDDDWGTMSNYMTEVDTYAQPMILKFITGEESLDKFDEFKQTCIDLGVNKAQAMWQDAYTKMIQSPK